MILRLPKLIRVLDQDVFISSDVQKVGAQLYDSRVSYQILLKRYTLDQVSSWSSYAIVLCTA